MLLPPMSLSRYDFAAPPKVEKLPQMITELPMEMLFSTDPLAPSPVLKVVSIVPVGLSRPIRKQ